MIDVFDFLSSQDRPRLVSPVTYQGAKVRLASEIIDQIGCDPANPKVFYDVCCGGGSITLELLNRGYPSQHIVMVDSGPWGAFWKSVTENTFHLEDFDGWLRQMPSDPNEISGWLKEVSIQPISSDQIPYLYILLQAGSFGGKAVGLKDSSWVTHGWRRYWIPTATSNRRSPVNPMMPMPGTIRERVCKLVGQMGGVTVMPCDASDLVPKDGIVYVDPPYQGTTGYTDAFDFDLLPLWARQGCNVWVSEGRPLSDKAFCISRGRSKGGVSGGRKKANEEWLSFFPSERSLE